MPQLCAFKAFNADLTRYVSGVVIHFSQIFSYGERARKTPIKDKRVHTYMHDNEKCLDPTARTL